MKGIWLTTRSSTHEEMYRKHFLPSFMENGLCDHFELFARPLSENPGRFGEKGFNEWGTKSMEWTLERLRHLLGQIVVTSGVDFHFYQPIGKELIEAIQSHEFVAANDVYFEACGDFNGFIVTDKIIQLYEWMINNDHRHANQEFTLNAGLQALGIEVLSLSHDYFTVGMCNGREWNPGDDIRVPPTIKMHHANFTVGAENKMRLLDEVEALISSQ